MAIDVWVTNAAKEVRPVTMEPREPLEVVAGDRSQRLGGRHECYACGAKFYDLNKPEPVCPKCQANQLQRPKEEPAAKGPKLRVRTLDET